MNVLSRHILLLALSGLFFTFALPLSATPDLPEAPWSAQDFCGNSAPPPKLICPETKAQQCYCSLQPQASHHHQSELAPPLNEALKETKVRRKRTAYRLLPSTAWVAVSITFEDSVPTPPPRF